MVKSRDNKALRLTVKEGLLTLAGTGLALGSLKTDDPVVVVPMLLVSCVAFVALCILYSGNRFKRSLTAIVICALIVFIGWRDLNTPARSAYGFSLTLTFVNGTLRVLDNQTVRYILCIVCGMISILIFQRAARWIEAYIKTKNNHSGGEKGILDYKMQAEVGMSSLGPILNELTRIVSNVGSSLELHADKVKNAAGRSAHAQVSVVRQPARMLDGYSIKFDKRCDDLERIGASLAEGLEGWLKWMSSQLSHSDAKEFQVPLVTMLESMEVAIASIDTYMAQLEATRGVSKDWNIAVDRHLTSMRRIREANSNIWISGSEGLRYLATIQTSTLTDKATL